MIPIDKWVEGQDPSPIVRALESDKKTLERVIRNLKLDLGSMEKFFLNLEAVIKMSDRHAPVLRKRKISRGNQISSPMVATSIVSDWHIGEYIEPDQLEQCNQYNYAVASERVALLADKFISWTEEKRHCATVDDCSVICIGDMISGDIHDELRKTNEFPVPVQVERAATLFSGYIAELSRSFKHVKVEYITSDNHARLTQKFEYKNAGLNSHNYLVGFLSKVMCERLENVEFNLYPVIKQLVNVNGIPYLCSHGNTIRGWAGLPWYGMDRAAAKEAKKRMRIPQLAYHKLIMAHYHTALFTPDYIVNGSLSGTSEYDHGEGRYSLPTQVGLMIHPKHAEHSFSPFVLG